MQNYDWKKALPFPRHWLAYLGFKLLILALAVFVAFHLLRFFEVI
jgi:hypothetical protein